MNQSSNKKLAIISSYNELCGNASYTQALVTILQRFYDVTVIPLDVTLLRTGHARDVAEYMRQLQIQLAEFDCVNIQFESALYGDSVDQIQRNFTSIAKACKNLVVTMHRFDRKSNNAVPRILAKSMLKLSPRLFINQMKFNFIQNSSAYICKAVIAFCKKNNIPILVHTPRDRVLIKIIFRYNNVFDHPLCFFSQEQIKSVTASYSKRDFCREYSLNENDVYLGIFGFISSYKGYETAIHALSHLPENHKLLIIGCQHPLSIKINEQINPYIDKLLNLIKQLRFSKRVIFMELPKEEDFLRALTACDYNLVPYLEVNQGGSGIAALSLETNSRAIFSQNLAFLELNKYAQHCFKMFSIGNHMELAQAVLSYRASQFSDALREYHARYNTDTSAAIYKKLLNREFQGCAHVQDEAVEVHEKDLAGACSS